jgi:hypothetical protein
MLMVHQDILLAFQHKVFLIGHGGTALGEVRFLIAELCEHFYGMIIMNVGPKIAIRHGQLIPSKV